MSDTENLGLSDYGNEPTAFFMRLNLLLHKKKAGTYDSFFVKGIDGVNDDELRAVVVEARKTHSLKTIEERYPYLFTGQPLESPTSFEIAAYIRKNPERAEIVDHCAKVMNTTLDMPAFKQAANDMQVAIFGYAKPVFIIANPIYRDEPPLKDNAVGDYGNEPLGLMLVIEAAMAARGVPKIYFAHHDIFHVDNTMLMDITTELRAKAAAEPQNGPQSKTTLIQTLHDRYLKPFYDAGEPLSADAGHVKKWMDSSPLRVARLDACVETINQSNDMDAFKTSMNDLCEIMELKPAFVIPHVFSKRPGAAVGMLARLAPPPPQ